MKTKTFYLTLILLIFTSCYNPSQKDIIRHKNDFKTSVVIFYPNYPDTVVFYTEDPLRIAASDGINYIYDGNTRIYRGTAPVKILSIE